MKHRRAHLLPLFIASCLFACLIAPACGGPRLTTLAPGVYGEAGEARSANAAGAPSTEAGAAGLSSTPEAGGGVPGDGGGRG